MADQVILGRCEDVMRGLPDNSVDAIVTAESLAPHGFWLFSGYNERTGQCLQHSRYGNLVSVGHMSTLSDKLPSTKECLVCGQSFKVKPSHFDKRKTCSKQCFYKSREKPKHERPCAHCGKLMSQYPSRAGHNRGVVCSKKCQYERNKKILKAATLVECTCLCCQKAFTISPSIPVSKKGAGKYCSRKCRDVHRVGANHPMYINGRGQEHRGPNWQAQKRAARVRDNFTCQHCGATNDTVLHVHHIIPYRLFSNYFEANKLDNLVTLCPSCHRIADAKIQSQEASKWTTSS